MTTSSSSGSFVIKPLSEAPKVLGGIPEASNPVDPLSEVGKLPRPQQLPGFSEIKKIKANHRPKFLSLWEGEIQVDWAMSPEDEDGEDDDDSDFTMEATIKCPRDDAAVLLVTLGYDSDTEQYRVDFPLFFDESFKCALKEKAQKALLSRIWHRILRTEGDSLPFPWEVFRVLCKFLLEYYDSQTSYEEALDVRILYADIAIVSFQRTEGRGYIENAAASLSCGANQLEALGLFGQAALLYKELALQYAVDNQMRREFWYYSGIANKSAENWKSAEESFFKALHYKIEMMGGSRNWKVNDEETKKYIESLMFVCAELAKVDEDDQTVFALMALFFAAGLKDSMAIGQFLEFGHRYSLRLKLKFQSARRAKDALADALSAVDVNSFRQQLVACFVGNRPIPNTLCGLEPFRVDQGDRVKAARDTAKDETPRINVMCVSCNNRECGKMEDGEAFKCCPCKAAIYCSKSCQRADFPNHKQHCKQVAKDKKKKKEAAAAAVAVAAQDVPSE